MPTLNTFSIPGSMLGLTVQDPVTGVSGIVTAEIMYLYGCQQVQISPQAKESEMHKIPDAFWLDRSRVEVLEKIPVIVPRYENVSGFTSIPPSRDPKGL